MAVAASALRSAGCPLLGGSVLGLAGARPSWAGGVMRGSDGGSDKVHRHARAVTVPRILVPHSTAFRPRRPCYPRGCLDSRQPPKSCPDAPGSVVPAARVRRLSAYGTC